MQERLQEVVRHSLRLAGSLHPVTRNALQDVIRTVDAHSCAALRATGWVVDPADVTVRAERQFEGLLLTVIELHSTARKRNGRPTIFSRTQSVLWPITGGLYSLPAGLARASSSLIINTQDYAEFFAESWLNEVERLSSKLSADSVKRELEKLVAARGHIPDVILPLHAIYAGGPVTSAEFSQMLGHKNKGRGDQIMAQLVADNL